MNIPVREGSKLYKTLLYTSTAFGVYNNAKHLYDNYQVRMQERRDSRKFTATISEDDHEIYYPVHRWVMSMVPEVDRSDVGLAVFHQELVEVPPRQARRYSIEFEGTSYEVMIEPPSSEMRADQTVFSVNRSDQMVFVCDTLQDREKLCRKLDSLIPRVAPEERELQVWRSRSKGSWSWVKRLSERPVGTLFLPEGMAEDMVRDITRFHASKDKYVARGIPYHRGYLLHGPPGTGKSSTITALASVFRKDVRFMSLSEMEGNSALIDSVSEVRSDSFLVLEDVDVVASTHNRDDSGGDHVSLDGLLNVLDGALTPEGLVTFMTTNHPESLDPALIRPGRADRQFELGYLTQDQLTRMVHEFVSPEYDVQLVRRDVAPSEVVECLKSSFDNDDDYVIECIREVVS